MEENIKEIIERIEKKLERKADYDTGVWLAQTDIENLLTRYKDIQLTDKEKEVVEAYRNLVKITGATGGWVVCDPKQMWSNYFIPKSKVKKAMIKDKEERYARFKYGNDNPISTGSYDYKYTDIDLNDYAGSEVQRVLQELLDS